ncbi:TPA: hypothetical protein DCZ39_04770 [Patescibacteria group bacterium]|nr:hypothetical protein [Candidatus Gracilibacteria bacterium]
MEGNRKRRSSQCSLVLCKLSDAGRGTPKRVYILEKQAKLCSEFCKELDFFGLVLREAGGDFYVGQCQKVTLRRKKNMFF